MKIYLSKKELSYMQNKKLSIFSYPKGNDKFGSNFLMNTNGFIKIEDEMVEWNSFELVYNFEEDGIEVETANFYFKQKLLKSFESNHDKFSEIVHLGKVELKDWFKKWEMVDDLAEIDTMVAVNKIKE